MKKLNLEKMEKIEGGSAPALDCVNMELAFATALGEANDAYHSGNTGMYQLYSAAAAGDLAWISANCYM